VPSGISVSSSVGIAPAISGAGTWHEASAVGVAGEIEAGVAAEIKAEVATASR
jgi:hypothetical protein